MIRPQSHLQHLRRFFVRQDVRTFMMVILVIALASLLIQTYHRALRPGGYDLTSYLLSASALLTGDNPYATETPFPYIYPLFLATVLIPLSLLPSWLVTFLWFAINVVAAAGCFRLMLEMITRESATMVLRISAAPVILLLVIFADVVQNHLLNGQVNLLVLLLCTLFVYLMDRKPMLAALCLGAAIATKLLPAILLVMILVYARWRLLVGSLVWTVVCLALPVLVGGGKVFIWYQDYFERFILANIAAAGDVPSGHDYTIAGLLSMVSSGAIDVWWVSAMVAVTVIIALMMAQVRLQKTETGFSRAGVFGLYMVVMLLLSPFPGRHHLVFMLPAMFVVWLDLFTFDMEWTVMELAAVVLTVASFLLGVLFPNGPAVLLSLLLLAGLVIRRGRLTHQRTLLMPVAESQS